MHQHQGKYCSIVHDRPKSSTSIILGRIYINKLITKYKVAKAEINQYKWEDKWGYNEVCQSKQSKQENPRNFTMVRHWWRFGVIPLATFCTVPPQMKQKCSSLSELWCYTCPWRHHICNKKRSLCWYKNCKSWWYFLWIKEYLELT